MVNGGGDYLEGWEGPGTCPVFFNNHLLRHICTVISENIQHTILTLQNGINMLYTKANHGDKFENEKLHMCHRKTYRCNYSVHIHSAGGRNYLSSIDNVQSQK